MTKKPFFQPIVLIGGALLLYVAAKAANFIQGLKITFSNISFSGTISNPVVILTLKVDNPSSTSVRIDEINGVLSYAGRKIADVESIKSENIDANSKVYFDVKAQATASSAVKLITDFISKRAANNFTFNGTVKVNGVPVPYNGKLQ